MESEEICAIVHYKRVVLCAPYDANRMRWYPLSRKLNNSRIDDAGSASPVILDAPTQAKLF
jgi:hypothetical protein